MRLPTLLAGLAAVLWLSGCPPEDPDDDVGLTEIVVANELAEPIVVSVELDPAIGEPGPTDVEIAAAAATLVAEGWQIGGWMRPSGFVVRLVVTAADGRVLIDASPAADELFELDPDADWQRSTYRLTIKP